MKMFVLDLEWLYFQVNHPAASEEAPFVSLSLRRFLSSLLATIGHGINPSQAPKYNSVHP